MPHKEVATAQNGKEANSLVSATLPEINHSTTPSLHSLADVRRRPTAHNAHEELSAAILEKLDHIWQEYARTKDEQEQQGIVEQQWRDAALILNRFFLIIYLVLVLSMFVYLFVHDLFWPH